MAYSFSGFPEDYDEENRYNATWRAELALDEEATEPIIVVSAVDDERLDYQRYLDTDLFGRIELEAHWLYVAVNDTNMANVCRAAELLGKAYANRPLSLQHDLEMTVAIAKENRLPSVLDG